MMRLTAALLVRIGLVLAVLAVLARLLPMPDRADAVADEFAIAVSLVLVIAAAAYLRLTRDPARPGPPSAGPDPQPARPGRREPQSPGAGRHLT
jgi:hypothetical protein